MKVLLLFAMLVLVPQIGEAVGTKKKKQKIHVRREFAGFLQAVPPLEFHDDTNNDHSLRCKGSGLERCRWKILPAWSHEYPLEYIDEVVMGAIRGEGGAVTPTDKPGIIEIFGGVTIRWWRLANGFEYIVEDV